MLKALPSHLRGTFEAFWAAYPTRRPNPRRPAEDAFARAVARGVAPDFLARAAGRFAAEVRARAVDSIYLPHARTWLAQERYADYPDPAEPTEPVIDRSVSQDPLGDRLTAAGIDATAQGAWFGRCRLSMEGKRLVVAAPTRFVADQIRDRWDAALRHAWAADSVEYRWPRGGP